MRKIILTTVHIAMLSCSIQSQAAGPAKPDGFPSRTISIVVPYGAGGGSDQVARAWGEAMQKGTGVGFQVENKPGGAGLAAIPDFMSRPADGYTVLEQTDGLITNAAAGQVEQVLNKDIIPICVTQSTFSQFYIRPDETRFTDWASFVAYAKAHPGDVKLGNIFLAEIDNGVIAPKLIDFGLTKELDAIAAQTLTAAGVRIGSPSYMSPEQARGRDVDTRSDVWSFCVVLFRMVTGRLPFVGETHVQQRIAIIEKRPPSFEVLGLDEPALWRIVERGLAKPLSERWQSMRELAAVLRAWLNDAEGKGA